MGEFIDKLSLVSVEDDENYKVSYRDRMVRILYSGLNGSLTERQRDCIQKYYGENKTMAEIARELSLNVSTVSRHIKAARKNLKMLSDMI